jgi:predicted RNA binding protein YcfA (HicA-like mRNA interferase family)
MFTVKNAIIQKSAFANLAKRDVSSKIVMHALKNYGFEEDRRKGSHIQFVKDGKRITVPEHGKKDIPE